MTDETRLKEAIRRRRGELGVQAVMSSIRAAKEKNGPFVTGDADAAALAHLYGVETMSMAEFMAQESPTPLVTPEVAKEVRRRLHGDRDDPAYR